MAVEVAAPFLEGLGALDGAPLALVHSTALHHMGPKAAVKTLKPLMTFELWLRVGEIKTISSPAHDEGKEVSIE